MNDGNASVLRKLTVFAGTESYVFEAMNLPGPNQVLRFVLRDGGIPALAPEGEAQPSARGESVPIALCMTKVISPAVRTGREL